MQSVDKLLFFNDDVDLRLAANSVINPLTSLCLKDILIKKGAKSVVYLGADSFLGRTFIRLARDSDIDVIAVIHKGK